MLVQVAHFVALARAVLDYARHEVLVHGNLMGVSLKVFRHGLVGLDRLEQLLLVKLVFNGGLFLNWMLLLLALLLVGSRLRWAPLLEVDIDFLDFGGSLSLCRGLARLRRLVLLLFHRAGLRINLALWKLRGRSDSVTKVGSASAADSRLIYYYELHRGSLRQFKFFGA